MKYVYFRNILLDENGYYFPNIIHINDEKKPCSWKKDEHIPVDGKCYLTHDGGENFTLWDQQDYPASHPIAQMNLGMARQVINLTKTGKKILNKIYDKYKSTLQDQARK